MQPQLKQTPIAGRAFGTFKLPNELEFVAARGSGPYLYSSEGNRYLDHVLGSGPLIVGHAHPRVVAALQEQLARGTTFYTLNEQALELATVITELVPCATGVKLVTSGSEAVFYALRIARAATGRQKIVKFEGAYHGHNDYMLHSLTPAGDPIQPETVPASDGIPSPVSDTVLMAPFNDLVSTEKLLLNHADEIAAVIVEPVQRLLEPVSGFLEGLRAACDRAGCLLIFDEVVTGFRIAPGGAQQKYGVIPDLCTLGKAVGGGLPLAAVAGRRELIELSAPGNGVYLSGTLNGNPLGATAGLATLRVLEEDNGYSCLAETGRQIIDGLLELGNQYSVPLQVVGPPQYPQPIFSTAEMSNARAVSSANTAAAKAFGHELIKRNVLVLPGAKLYLSTVHGDEQVGQLLDAAAGALRAVRESGVLD